MPYIKSELRPEIDQLVAPLIEHLQKIPLEKRDGALNYLVTKLLKALYQENYFDLNRSMGVLAAIQAEWYRTHIAPYEDKKIIENGDVA